MKCQHCGNHEANYHYRSSINGVAAEVHLCTICAQEAGGGVFTGSALTRSMEELFGGNALKRSLFGGNFFSRPLGAADPFAQSPFFTPITLAVGGPIQVNPSAPPEPGESKVPIQADDTLKRRRALNQLRGEMETAIKNENFERAAELRDEIYRLEKDA